MAELQYEAFPNTIENILNLYRNDHLNLSPGFQRNSVWTERDRAKLIDSIVRNYPLPSIFLYRRQKNGEIVYDVIDGKQRIESILMFIGLVRGQRFWARVQLPGDDERDWVNWQSLCRRKKQSLITGYKLQTIEVNGDTADIIDLFVRINSTGKALTPSERRHARFYNSDFLKTAARLASRYEDYFLESSILTASQISRMKHVELISELMISVHQGGVINKKAALDRVMESNSLTATQTEKAARNTVSALNRIRRMFSNLDRTRFCQLSDFYSLVVLAAKFEAEKLILTDRRRNKLARDLLAAFSTGVDLVRELQKKAKGIKTGQELYRDYLLTVIQSTDEISQRQKRENILRGLFESLFKRKDPNRLFSQEQRRILWNTSAARRCECGKLLTWGDFSIDHIKPFSKGGRTKLENAALMCRQCNSKKGSRRR